MFCDYYRLAFVLLAKPISLAEFCAARLLLAGSLEEGVKATVQSLQL